MVAKMAFARRIEMDADTVVSEEAKRRVDTARIGDMAFRIKKTFPEIGDDDADILAHAMLNAFDDGPITRDAIYKQVFKLTNSAEVAKRLSARFS
jgi:hypothetical protein